MDKIFNILKSFLRIRSLVNMFGVSFALLSLPSSVSFFLSGLSSLEILYFFVYVYKVKFNSFVWFSFSLLKLFFSSFFSFKPSKTSARCILLNWWQTITMFFLEYNSIVSFNHPKIILLYVSTYILLKLKSSKLIENYWVFGKYNNNKLS